MRIPIREQLGGLVLISSLVGLAVIAIATWVTVQDFVLGIRASRLELTASLKAAQLASNLLLMQLSTRAVSTRVLIQSALQRYNDGNNTVQNWTKAISDLSVALAGESGENLLLQARVYPKNNTGPAGSNPVMQRTGENILRNVMLPYYYDNGTQVALGDLDLNDTNADPRSYPPALYPNLTYTELPVNETFNTTVAQFDGATFGERSLFLLGPVRMNNTFSMASITMPVINNTSAIDILGWMTIVLDARLIEQVVSSLDGLDDTGLTLLVGPQNGTNKFASEPSRTSDGDVPENELVRYVLPPTQRNDTKPRHMRNPTNFNYTSFPAVENGFKQIAYSSSSGNNADSRLRTKNDDGQNVAVGYARPDTSLVDWLILVEETHKEVWAPIDRLRNLIIACVFGTAGAMLIVAFPIAHYSSRQIRRLRDATLKSVLAPGFEDDDDGSPERSQLDGADEKKGLAGYFSKWMGNSGANSVERNENARRRQFRIPAKVKEHRHFIHDELTDLTHTFNEMTEELMMQYEKLEERVQHRTQELELSKKAAEAANESKTLFIANISHELKTPLNGILGMCAVCMSEDDPIKLKRSLGIIYKSGDLLLNLLTDLLTFSKNQVGQQLSLDEKEFRLRDVSTQMFAIFDRQAKESGIDLKVNFEGVWAADTGNEYGKPQNFNPTGLAPFGLGRVKDMILWGDQHRILQVVINLVSNSLKFTPSGGSVTLTVRCIGDAEDTNPSRRTSQNSGSMISSRVSARNSKKRFGSESSSHRTSNIHTANEINATSEKQQIFTQIMAADGPKPAPKGRNLTFEFEVHDTGPGIPDNLQGRIFEPFVQGDLGLSKKYGGTGLGLSICSQLASLMKGSIELESEVGRGSTFTMRIPLRHLISRADSTASSSVAEPLSRRTSTSFEDAKGRSTEEDGNHNQNSAHSSSNPGPVTFDSDTKPRLVGLSQPFFAANVPLESPNSQMKAMERVEAEATMRGDKIKVLVAEDNKVNQEVVLRMLKLEEVYDVTVAKDGQEAFDRVKESMESQNPYHLIFMDVQMPNLDGLQSTRMIRQAGYSAPIVALTAFAEESNVKECLDSGMDYFLAKPIRRPQLKHVLKTYCPPIPEEEGESCSSPRLEDYPLQATQKKSAVVYTREHSVDSPDLSPLTMPSR